MAVWWVNQGQTLDQEIEHGCVSARRLDAAGRVPWHWATLTKMQPGDLTLHVARRAIRAVGVVLEGATELDAPPYESDLLTDAGGIWLVPVEYHLLERPILVGTMAESLRPQPPFNRRGNLQQISCCAFDDSIAGALAAHYRDRWPTASPFADPAAWPS